MTDLFPFEVPRQELSDFDYFWPENADWPEGLTVPHPDHNVFPVLDDGHASTRAADKLALGIMHFGDPLNMNTWPRWHVVMKVSGMVWYHGEPKPVRETWTESWYTRAPSPDEAMKAPTLLIELRGDRIVNSDFAFVPEWEIVTQEDETE